MSHPIPESYLRDQAQFLRRDLTSGDPHRTPGACGRVRRAKPHLASLGDAALVADVSHLDLLDTIAVEQGFPHWRALVSRTPSPATPGPALRLVIEDESGSGQATAVELNTAHHGVPRLVWVAPDGTPLAAVLPDLCEGKFQFLVYGREQLEGDDGWAAIRFSPEGTITAVLAEDFNDPHAIARRAS